MEISDSITLGHGAGGLLSQQLIKQEFLPLLSAAGQALNDAAVISVGGVKLAFSTDSFTVSPLFFPGGDIGSLAVHGTINDVAMMGAQPRFLSLAFIVEEGFATDDLHQITTSIQQAAHRSQVDIVTGDTKVVQRGAADGLFINTSGLGIVYDQAQVDPGRIEVGDAILINGTIADHGVAVLCAREELEVAGEVLSDSAPLAGLVGDMIAAVGPQLHCLRDPTRGGVAATLNEIAQQAQITAEIHEDALPIKPPVAAICEILGLDPLQVACEGKLIAFVAAEAVEETLAVMKSTPLGEESEIIGEVVGADAAQVRLRTSIGTSRIVDMPAGELLPRIC